MRLWQEPAPRKLQQCILHVTDDADERNKAKSAGLIWVPVLNHRLNGQVKGATLSAPKRSSLTSARIGVVVHRDLNGLCNDMKPSVNTVELTLKDPKGNVYRRQTIPAKALLTPFSFDIGGEARTGTFTSTHTMHRNRHPDLDPDHSLDERMISA